MANFKYVNVPRKAFIIETNKAVMLQVDKWGVWLNKKFLHNEEYVLNTSISIGDEFKYDIFEIKDSKNTKSIDSERFITLIRDTFKEINPNRKSNNDLD